MNRQYCLKLDVPEAVDIWLNLSLRRIDLLKNMLAILRMPLEVIAKVLSSRDTGYFCTLSGSVSKTEVTVYLDDRA